jgi:alkylation response protein AidB-like acyl-CoA dehydrogenase
MHTQQMPEFFQDAPRLGNQWQDDRPLRALVARLLPPDVHAALAPGLDHLGARAGGDLLALADAAEAEPPRHVPFDAWGRRVDRIDVSDAWRALDRVAAEEAIVASAYERAHGAFARLHQAVRLYLYHPSSAIYSCPLAMTDGAARCLTRQGGDDPYFADVVARLTSRDPARFWTSGQWMTERTGGSDVSGTSTVARRGDDGSWRLSGTKWFTSATTSQIALTLARIEGDATPGGAGLSLFQVELRDAAGALRGIRVERLKDKLGTRALPTAELTLESTPARLVGEVGNGVRRIADVLNVTRFYNAVCAAGQMRRCVALAADYATRREAFGRPLAAHPLHVETLAAMQLEAEGALHLVLHLATLMGLEEHGEASAEDVQVLRVLTPVAKLFTARQAVAVASEALECFGGAGYVEDTGLPRLLRDAQVLAIWEGTTNVLSLDVLRAAARGDAIGAFRDATARRLDAVINPTLAPAVRRVRHAMDALVAHLDDSRDGPMDDARAQAEARDVAFAIARIATGALLLAHAESVAPLPSGPRAIMVAERWCAQPLAPGVRRDVAYRAASAAILWDAASASAPSSPRKGAASPSALASPVTR